MAKQAEGASAPKAPKSSGPAPAADVAHKPFGVLLASQPPAMAGGIRSGILSTIFHVSLAAIVIVTTIQGPEEEEEETTYVELVEEVPVPPPPPPPPPPQLTPDMPNVTVISQIEIPTVILDNIPAPALDVVFDVDRLSTGTGTIVERATNNADSTVANPDNPSFTPMTVRPTLTNADEVSRVLMREYPAVLRDAGIGGAPVLWLFIGTDGRVETTRVYESSGFEALDNAAANVAEVMRFTPAYNRDQIVPVWVQIPIRFQVVN
jgi:protein TonB